MHTYLLLQPIHLVNLDLALLTIFACPSDLFMNPVCSTHTTASHGTSSAYHLWAGTKLAMHHAHISGTHLLACDPYYMQTKYNHAYTLMTRLNSNSAQMLMFYEEMGAYFSLIWSTDSQFIPFQTHMCIEQPMPHMKPSWIQPLLASPRLIFLPMYEYISCLVLHFHRSHKGNVFIDSNYDKHHSHSGIRAIYASPTSSQNYYCWNHQSFVGETSVTQSILCRMKFAKSMIRMLSWACYVSCETMEYPLNLLLYLRYWKINALNFILENNVTCFIWKVCCDRLIVCYDTPTFYLVWKEITWIRFSMVWSKILFIFARWFACCWHFSEQPSCGHFYAYTCLEINCWFGGLDKTRTDLVISKNKYVTCWWASSWITTYLMVVVRSVSDATSRHDPSKVGCQLW